jgi:2-amino-4-hydroxy-6-hydroxymethyldihydropteridine diphosphokinase
VSVAIIGVGTNLGAREAAIHAARELLDARDAIEVTDASAIYETAPLGPPQGDYLNAALRLETSLPPEELLRVLLSTERRLGRERAVDQRWGPRSVDLDLLWDERGQHRSHMLVVPHPELTKRNFALAPLLDVAPELAPEYEEALRHAGGAPPKWERASITAREALGGQLKVTVEADSIEDACAIAASQLPSSGPSWSTRHAALEASPRALARALRDLFRTGFAVSCVTVSHCSQAQWIAQFHGTISGAPVASDVRLQTTSGSNREVSAELAIDLVSSRG